MRKLFLAAIAVSVLSSCVKLEVKPEGLISDTVEVGKNIYKSVKAHKDGLQEREFSHSIAIVGNEEQAQAECSEALYKKINGASKNKAQILSESTEISDAKNRLKCSAKAMI